MHINTVASSNFKWKMREHHQNDLKV